MIRSKLTKLTNLVQAIAELPNAIHACVEMAHEAATMRKVGAFDIMSGAQLYEANSKNDELRREIERLTSEANDLARAAEQERRELAREREARRPRKQSEEPCPLKDDTIVLWRLSPNDLWIGLRASTLIAYPGTEWRYVSPEDMP